MKKKSILLNPLTFTGEEFDEKSRKAMLDTIAFFEKKGLKAIRQDDKCFIWQDDWMKYQKEHGIFATMLTAQGYGDDPDARFDLYRLCPMSEILGFYGEAYQYPLQVSILGVGPIWMSDNEFQKRELAEQPGVCMGHEGSVLVATRAGFTSHLPTRPEPGKLPFSHRQ